MPGLLRAHAGASWLSYDAEGDVAYVSFCTPNLADSTGEIERDALVARQMLVSSHRRNTSA